MRGEINWLSLMELAFSSLAPFGPHYSPLLAPRSPIFPLPLFLSFFPLSRFSPLSLCQTSFELSERYRPLLLAAVKGFLTRRLLRSERVAQLVRTVRVSRDRGACVKWFFRYFLILLSFLFESCVAKMIGTHIIHALSSYKI